MKGMTDMGENKIPEDIKSAVEKSLADKRVRIEEREGGPEQAVVRHNPVVYSTATGEEPRGAITLTQEATAELPPPVKKIVRKTTKKHKPRVKAKAEPLHTEIKVNPDVWAKAKEVCRPGEHLVIIDETTVITEYDSGLVARIVPKVAS